MEKQRPFIEFGEEDPDNIDWNDMNKILYFYYRLMNKISENSLAINDPENYLLEDLFYKYNGRRVRDKKELKRFYMELQDVQTRNWLQVIRFRRMFPNIDAFKVLPEA